MKPRVLRNWIWLVPLAAVLWAVLLSPLWGAAPTVVLDIPSVTATRMEPCPVNAGIEWASSDAGESDTANLGGLAWTNTTGSEYKLDVTLRSLSVYPGIYHITEGAGLSNAELTQGAAGSLAAGQWDFVNGVLHIRLSDSSNPNSAAGADITAYTEYSVEQLRIFWRIYGVNGTTVDDWPDKWRYCEDPRPPLNNRQIDMTGNDTSDGNRPRGFNMGWLVIAGEYQIEAKAINPSGYEDTETSSTVTIAENTRTPLTVGSDPGDDYATLAACLADDPELTGTIIAERDNYEITLEDGHTEDALAPLSTILGGSLYIHQEGTGSRPKITFADATATGFVTFWTLNGENTVIEGIELAESNGNMGTGQDGTLSLGGFRIAGTQNAFYNCGTDSDDTTYWVKTAFGPYLGCDGALILKCTTDTTWSYSVVTDDNQTDNIAVIGCRFSRSEAESVCRTLDNTDNINFLWTQCDNDETKSAIRLWHVDRGHIYGCWMHAGDNSMGDDEGKPDSAYRVRVEGNYIDGNASAGMLASVWGNDAAYVVACNNIVETADADGAIGTGGDYYILAHNTLHCLEGFSVSPIRSRSARATHYINNNLTLHDGPSDIGEYGFDINVLIAECNNNIVPARPGGSWTTFARAVVGAIDGGDDLNYPTLELFNATTFATGNESKDVTLDSQYISSDPTTVTTEPGVYDDFWGTARALTSWSGAVGSQPSGGTPSTPGNAFIQGLYLQSP